MPWELSGKVLRPSRAMRSDFAPLKFWKLLLPSLAASIPPRWDDGESQELTPLWEPMAFSLRLLQMVPESSHPLHLVASSRASLYNMGREDCLSVECLANALAWSRSAFQWRMAWCRPYAHIGIPQWINSLPKQMFCKQHVIMISYPRTDPRAKLKALGLNWRAAEHRQATWS